MMCRKQLACTVHFVGERLDFSVMSLKRPSRLRANFMRVVTSFALSIVFKSNLQYFTVSFTLNLNEFPWQ